VQATNDGYGNWSASITPIGVGGGAVVVRAMMAGGRSNAPALQQIVQPPQGVFVSNYHMQEQRIDDDQYGTNVETYYNSTDWDDGVGGNAHYLDYSFHPPVGFYFGHDCDWPAASWPQSLPDGTEDYLVLSNGVFVPDTNSFPCSGPELPGEHCVIAWATSGPDFADDGYRKADTEMKLAFRRLRFRLVVLETWTPMLNCG
jgi:hypothetical protein